MAVYKRKYKDQTGRTQQTGKYYLRITDHNGIRRQLPAFEAKRPSELLFNRIQELISYRTAGQTAPADVQAWIDGLPAGIVDKLVKWDIISGGRQSAGVLVADHVRDFQQSLTDKGCDEKHITTIIPRIKNTLNTCKVVSISDISLNAVQRHISGLQAADQTKKHYIRALKQFSTWLYHTGRTSTDMLSRLDMPAVNETVRDRRALTTQEAARLLQAAKNSDVEYRGVSGYERYLIYSLALSTGLRANEIRTLTISDFNFIGHTVSVKPRNEKARRGATLPLRQELSEEIRAFTAGKLPMTKALNVPTRTADMMQVDLMAAGIEYQSDAGFADFHALRHTFGTNLAKAGVTPQISQRLMRHSDPKLTQNLYTHLLVADLKTGTDKLPDYNQIQEKARATGTADKTAFSLDTKIDTNSSADNGILRTLADKSPVCGSDILKAKNPVFDTKNAVFNTENRAFETVPTVRLELTTAGLQNRCSKITSTDKTNTYDTAKNHLIPPLTPNRAPEAQNQPVFDEDLQAIIDHWKDLPKHIRQTIKTIVETAGLK